MDKKTYPVNVIAEYPESSDRTLALAGLLFMIPKAVILLPHLIILWALNFVLAFLVFIGYVIVLITGKYNKDLFNFVTGYQRWQLRVQAYLYGITDVYPPFRLEE